MNKTILLTGITGAVGQSITPVLKQHGYRLVYLARPKGIFTGKDRAKQLLGDVLTSDDVCCEGDLAENLHLDPLPWRGKIDAVLHCAGSISFESSAADETWRVNVDGTENMLRLANELAIPHFHFISTAYVAGSAEVFTEADVYVGQQNSNQYEESKRAAEELVRSFRGSSTIYRMSIMIGHSTTFVTPSFNGYYGFFQSLWRLRQSLKRRWKTESEALRAERVIFSEKDRLFIPLTIHCSPTSTLNLIPCDWFSETLSEVLKLSCGHRATQIYHLTHPNPPRVQWVIEETLSRMGIDGITCIATPRGGASGGSPLSVVERFQKVLDRGLERFHPYITHEPRFTCDALKRDLGTRYHAPREIDSLFLANLIEFAMRMNFGK